MEILLAGKQTKGIIVWTDYKKQLSSDLSFFFNLRKCLRKYFQKVQWIEESGKTSKNEKYFIFQSRVTREEKVPLYIQSRQFCSKLLPSPPDHL